MAKIREYICPECHSKVYLEELKFKTKSLRGCNCYLIENIEFNNMLREFENMELFIEEGDKIDV